MNTYIDLHTHGAVNVDVNTASEEDLFKLSDFYAQHGVAAWLPTVMTDTYENMFRAVETVTRAMKNQKSGAKMLGIHLEGPFLNPMFAGAMPLDLLKEGDCKFVEKCQKISDGKILKITLAPEIKGNLDIVKNFSDTISCSMGHSNATYDEAMKAIKAGANCTTHTGNAMRLFHQHEPGLFGAALDSDIYCEMIGDGLHVAPASAKLLIKLKGINRICVITDSMSATGMGDGFFTLGGGNKVVVKGGDCRLVERDSRAGSVLTMDKAFENIQEFTGLSAEEIRPMFCDNQKAVLRLTDF